MGVKWKMGVKWAIFPMKYVENGENEWKNGENGRKMVKMTCRHANFMVFLEILFKLSDYCVL